MALSLTRAIAVKPGDKITSTVWNSIATAGNDRLIYGLGDGPFRIRWQLAGLFRNIRNPDASGFLFPPNLEFFEVYQSVKPQEAQWPITGAGEPEGINVTSPLGAYIFGIESENFPAEQDSIGGIPTQIGFGGPTTPLQIWILRQAQVGAIDPETGAVSQSMMLAARNYMRLVYNSRAPFLNTWGGNLPIPETGAECAAPDEFTPPPPDWLYLFTATSVDVSPAGLHGTITATADGLAVVTYPGSCPEIPEHVSIVYYDNAYVVRRNDGSWTDVLPREFWFEGPYRGGGLARHAFGDTFSRMLAAFLQEFRGTPDQIQEERDRKKPVNHAAFKNRQFFGQQYRLAPQRGHEDGDFTVAEYTRWVWRAAGPSHSAGGFARIDATGSEFHEYLPGWSLVVAFSGAAGLLNEVTIEAVDERPDGTDVVLGQFTLTPDATHDAQVLWNLDVPAYPHRLGFRLLSAAYFSDGNGRMLVESSETYPYKPGTHDAAAVVRLVTEQIGQAPAGTGPNTDTMVERAACYFDSSTIWNGDVDGLAPDLDVINTNPVFDAARRWSECLKVVTRRALRGYAIEDGKSVLWFQRYYDGGTSGVIDFFEGVASSKTPVRSSQIMGGRSYKVTGDYIVYGGHVRPAGSTVTGVDGVWEYSGPGALIDTDGIYYSAPRGGYSNRWILDIDFKAYHPSDSSNWKPDAYSDYFGMSDRCLFKLSGFYASIPYEMQYQMVNGDLAPEIASAYRYSYGMNKIECADDDTDCIAYRLNFYKSCQIYAPPAVVESAVTVIEDGVEMVKITLTGRLQKTDAEPDTFDRDVFGWDFGAIDSEPHRTASNGIRAYLVSQYTGRQCNPGGIVGGQAGNHAALSSVQTDPDKPYGACYPSFFLHRLLRTVNEDDNDTPTPNDTPFCSEEIPFLGLYVQGMSEGFVDGETSKAYACASGVASWFAWTWQNLCFAANRAPWELLAPKVQTGRLQPSDIRTDVPKGFGPLPGMPSAAAVIRQYAEMLNLLDQVAVMLPTKFEVRTLSGSTTKLVVVTDPDGTAMGCSTGAGIHGVYYGTPDNAGNGTVGDWGDAGAASASSGANIILGTCPEGDGGLWALVSTRFDIEYRWTLVDPDALYAVPSTWRDMVGTNGNLLVGRTTEIDFEGANPVNDGTGNHCCRSYQEPCIEYWPLTAGGALKFGGPTPSVSECTFIPATGIVSAPAPPAGAFQAGSNSSPDGDTHCNAGTGASVTITPILNDGVIVKFPLVDYFGG